MLVVIVVVEVVVVVVNAGRLNRHELDEGVSREITFKRACDVWFVRSVSWWGGGGKREVPGGAVKLFGKVRLKAYFFFGTGLTRSMGREWMTRVDQGVMEQQSEEATRK